MRLIGRASPNELKELPPGADCRLPQYRRETFLRFYEFHLENRSHPGCVYYAMPWLAQKHAMTQEEKLWMAFLNGNTQNIVTTRIIARRFPELPKDVTKLTAWFNESWPKLAWDTDRRYQKKDFPAAVENYRRLTEGRQKDYFRTFSDGQISNNTVVTNGGPELAFSRAWDVIRKEFFSFGRLATFSYMEYLRIVGVPLQCTTLFLNDMSGSKSHRNGIAKVLGRDDMDWHDSTDFTGDYSKEELSWLEREASGLLEEAAERVYHPDVGYFTLESALCTYKSWHRKNRRYPNCYNDMFHDRIKWAEQKWGAEEVAEFWTMREECVAPHLRQEANRNDPGLCPEKQNFYRETGRPIMMSKRWPEFDCEFDRRIWS